MIWNHDIAAAPRGQQVTVTRKVRTAEGYAERDFTEHHVAPLWLARADGKVVRSYWVPETKQSAGRWAGFAENEQPVVWQPFIVPDHPFQAKASGDNGATVHGEDDPADSVTGDASRSSRGDDSPASNSETDAAISRPGIASLGRPEIENRSDEEAPESEASGGVQDRLRVHPATNSFIEA